MSETTVKSAARPSLWKDLLERRFPQIIGSFLVASWAVVQFIEWLVQRFLWSPYWVDLALLLTLCALPGVCLVAYFHGRPGPDRWTLAEKIFVPINILLMVVLTFFFLQGKSMGKVGTKVTVEDENGNIEQRVVPTAEFRKKVAIFPFEQLEGSDENLWMGIGLPFGLDYDLSQDIYIQSANPFNLLPALAQEGIEDLNNIPFNLCRELAQQYHLDYFLLGTYTYTDGELSITTNLYETKTGKEQSAGRFQGSEFFQLIDEISLQTKKDLGQADAHIENTIDLEVKNILTESIPAYEHFIKAQLQVNQENDYAGAAETMQKALEHDEHFALAMFYGSANLINSTRVEEGKVLMEQAMNNLYVLPEKLKFLVKSLYYMMEENAEKRYKVLHMWKDLYPEDVQVYQELAGAYWWGGKADEAEKVYLEAIEIDDNRGYFLLSLGNIRLGKKDFEGAEYYFTQFAQKYPDDPAATLALARMYRDQGLYDQAIEKFEEALLLDDGFNTENVLISIIARKGDYQEALKRYKEQVPKAKTARDKESVLRYLSTLYYTLGNTKEAVELFEERIEVMSQYDQPMNIAFTRMAALDWYLEAELYPEVEMMLEEMDQTFAAGDFSGGKEMGYLQYYIDQQRFTEARASLDKYKEFCLRFGAAVETINAFEGDLAFAMRDYTQARDFYIDYLEGLSYQNFDYEVKLARCYRELGQLSEAQETLDQLFKIFHKQPKGHLEQAQIYLKQGEDRKAREYLMVSKQIWQNADDNFEPLQEVNRLLSNI